MKITPACRLRRSAKIKVRNEKYGALVFSVGAQGICLNEAGLAVLNLVAGNRSAAEVCREFETRCGRNHDENVMKVLNFLAANFVIEVVPLHDTCAADRTVEPHC